MYFSTKQEALLEDIKQEATQLLNQVLPIMLRFMADEYDDTCSTVFPLLQNILLGVGSTNSLILF